MTAGAHQRHPDPAAWVRRLFARQVRGEIDHLNVALQVGQLADVRGGVWTALQVTFLDADGHQRDLGALVWPADVPEVAEAMRAGALALMDAELRASWAASVRYDGTEGP